MIPNRANLIILASSFYIFNMLRNKKAFKRIETYISSLLENTQTLKIKNVTFSKKLPQTAACESIKIYIKLD